MHARAFPQMFVSCNMEGFHIEKHSDIRAPPTQQSPSNMPINWLRREQISAKFHTLEVGNQNQIRTAWRIARLTNALEEIRFVPGHFACVAFGTS
jgi:hypothetical protein